MKRTRFAIVGCGHRGVGLFNLAVNSFDALPVAACDVKDDLLNDVKEEHPGIKLYNDFDKMLENEELDAVLISTPATFHSEFCSKALLKDINVFSEVPAVASYEEAEQLWAAGQKTNAMYMMGANPNMWGFVNKAAEIVESGSIGSPYYMEAEYLHDLGELLTTTPWRGTYRAIRYCTHSLGPLLRLIEEDLESVSCFDTGSHVNKVPDQHDLMSAIFKTKSNVVVRLVVSIINFYPNHGHGYRVFGSKGYFERRQALNGAGPAITMYYSSEEHEEKKMVQIPVGEKPEHLLDNPDAKGHGGADYALLEAFFNALDKGLESPISMKEALRMSLPGIFADESALKGGELTKIRYPWS